MQTRSTLLQLIRQCVFFHSSCSSCIVCLCIRSFVCICIRHLIWLQIDSCIECLRSVQQSKLIDSVYASARPIRDAHRSIVYFCRLMFRFFFLRLLLVSNVSIYADVFCSIFCSIDVDTSVNRSELEIIGGERAMENSFLLSTFNLFVNFH